MNDISLFDFIDELEPEDIQKEVVAADLSMLLVHSDYSRTRLGADLGYGKSRISRILSGDENLTLKTLTKVADALGYTFDVVFYNKNYPKPKQPWNIDRDNKKLNISNKVSARKVFNLEIQTLIIIKLGASKKHMFNKMADSLFFLGFCHGSNI